MQKCVTIPLRIVTVLLIVRRNRINTDDIVMPAAKPYLLCIFYYNRCSSTAFNTPDKRPVVVSVGGSHCIDQIKAGLIQRYRLFISVPTCEIYILTIPHRPAVFQLTAVQGFAPVPARVLSRYTRRQRGKMPTRLCPDKLQGSVRQSVRIAGKRHQ